MVELASEDMVDLKAEVKILSRSMVRIEKAISEMASQSERITLLESRVLRADKDLSEVARQVRENRTAIDKASWLPILITAIGTAVATGSVSLLLTGGSG